MNEEEELLFCLFLVFVVFFLIEMENENDTATSLNWGNDDFEDSLLTNFDLEKACTLNNSRLRNDEKYSGFDNNSGDSWIYPNNLPVRSYQFEIARNSLFRNTLVVLP